MKTHVKSDTADVELGFLQVIEADGDEVVGEVQEAQVHQNQIFTWLHAYTHTHFKGYDHIVHRCIIIKFSHSFTHNQLLNTNHILPYFVH